MAYTYLLYSHKILLTEAQPLHIRYFSYLLIKQIFIYLHTGSSPHTDILLCLFYNVQQQHEIKKVMKSTIWWSILYVTKTKCSYYLFVRKKKFKVLLKPRGPIGQHWSPFP